MALGKSKEEMDLLLKLLEKALWEEKSLEMVSGRMKRIFKGHGAQAQTLLNITYSVVSREDNPLQVAELLSQRLRAQKVEAYMAVAEQVALTQRVVPYSSVAESVLHDGFDAERYASFSALTSFISKNYPPRKIKGDTFEVKPRLFREFYQGRLKGLAYGTLRDALENHNDADLDLEDRLETRILRENSYDDWIKILVSEVEQAEIIPIAKRKDLKNDLRVHVGVHAPAAYLELAQAKPRILEYILREGYLQKFLSFFSQKDGFVLRAHVTDSLHNFLAYAEKIIQATHSVGEDVRRDEFEKSLDTFMAAASFEDLFRSLRHSGTSFDSGSDEQMVQLKHHRVLYERISSVFALRSLLVTEGASGLTTSCSMPVSFPNVVQFPEFVRCFDTEDENQEVMRLFLYLQAGMGRFQYWGDTVPNKDTRDRFLTFSNPDFANALFSTLAYACVSQDIDRTLPRLGEQLKKTRKNIGQRYETGSLYDDAVQKYEEARLLIEKYLVFGVSGTGSSLLRNIQPFLDGINKDSLDGKVVEIYNAIDTLVGIPSQKDFQGFVSGGGSQKRVLTLHEQTGSRYNGQPIFYFREGTQDVRVIETIPHAHPNLRVQEIRTQNQHAFETLKNLFQGLKPQRVIHETRVYDGEIDEDLYRDALQDARDGFVPDTNFFRNRLVRDRDNAVLLTVDLPRKIMTPLVKRLEGKVIQLDYIRQTLVSMTDVLSIMDDDFAVMSYGSRGAEEVFVQVLKGFDERYTVEAEHRIGMIAPILHSRTGSVYHRFGELFSERPAVRRIHIDIVSQLALDTDYKRPESIALTAKGASRERALGIELFALCLDKTADSDMLTEVYGPGHFVRVEDLEDLDRSAIQLYRVLRFQS